MRAPPRDLDSVQPTSTRSPRNATLALLAKVAVSATLIGVLLWRIDIQDVMASFRSARPLPLAYAFALTFIGYYLSVSRWRVLLTAHGVRPSLLTLTRSHMAAIFVNNLLPSTIGGDTVRAYDCWRFGTSRTAAVAVIVMDRLSGMVALLLCAVGALVVSGPLLGQRSWWLAAAFAAAAAAGIAFAWVAHSAHRLPALPLPARLHATVRATTDRVALAFQAFSANRSTLTRAFALAFLLQINVIAYYALIAAAFDLPVPLPAFFVLIPIALAVMLLPISVNAIGLRENVFVYLLGLYGVAAPQAIAFAWAAFGIMLVHAVMGGVAYALGGSVPRPTATPTGGRADPSTPRWPPATGTP